MDHELKTKLIEQLGQLITLAAQIIQSLASSEHNGNHQQLKSLDDMVERLRQDSDNLKNGDRSMKVLPDNHQQPTTAASPTASSIAASSIAASPTAAVLSGQSPSSRTDANSDQSSNLAIFKPKEITRSKKRNVYRSSQESDQTMCEDEREDWPAVRKSKRVYSSSLEPSSDEDFPLISRPKPPYSSSDKDSSPIHKSKRVHSSSSEDSASIDKAKRVYSSSLESSSNDFPLISRPKPPFSSSDEDFPPISTPKPPYSSSDEDTTPINKAKQLRSSSSQDSSPIDKAKRLRSWSSEINSPGTWDVNLNVVKSESSNPNNSQEPHSARPSSPETRAWLDEVFTDDESNESEKQVPEEEHRPSTPSSNNQATQSPLPDDVDDNSPTLQRPDGADCEHHKEDQLVSVVGVPKEANDILKPQEPPDLPQPSNSNQLQDLNSSDANNTSNLNSTDVNGNSSVNQPDQPNDDDQQQLAIDGLIEQNQDIDHVNDGHAAISSPGNLNSQEQPTSDQQPNVGEQSNSGQHPTNGKQPASSPQSTGDEKLTSSEHSINGQQSTNGAHSASGQHLINGKQSTNDQEPTGGQLLAKMLSDILSPSAAKCDQQSSTESNRDPLQHIDIEGGDISESDANNANSSRSNESVHPAASNSRLNPNDVNGGDIDVNEPSTSAGVKTRPKKRQSRKRKTADTDGGDAYRRRAKKSFRKERPSWMTECEHLLDDLISEADSMPFLAPIDLTEYHEDYLKEVSTPMNLCTIKEKLLSGNYDEPKDLDKDLELIFEDAMLYHMNSTIRETAEGLQELATREMKKILRYYAKHRSNEEVVNDDEYQPELGEEASVDPIKFCNIKDRLRNAKGTMPMPQNEEPEPEDGEEERVKEDPIEIDLVSDEE